VRKPGRVVKNYNHANEKSGTILLGKLGQFKTLDWIAKSSVNERTFQRWKQAPEAPWLEMCRNLSGHRDEHTVGNFWDTGDLRGWEDLWDTGDQRGWEDLWEENLMAYQDPMTALQQ
jgi:hypothetical protein